MLVLVDYSLLMAVANATTVTIAANIIFLIHHIENSNFPIFGNQSIKEHLSEFSIGGNY
jgi:uncharacterized membrane protein (DUF441 family)